MSSFYSWHTAHNWSHSSGVAPNLYSGPDIPFKDWPCKVLAQRRSHRLWLSGRKKDSGQSLCVERIFTQFLRLHKHIGKSFTLDGENKVSPPSQLGFSGYSWTDFSIYFTACSYYILLLVLLGQQLCYLHLCDWTRFLPQGTTFLSLGTTAWNREDLTFALSCQFK